MPYKSVWPVWNAMYTNTVVVRGMTGVISNTLGVFRRVKCRLIGLTDIQYIQ